MTDFVNFDDFALGRRQLQVAKQPFRQKILALPAYHWLLLALTSTAVVHVGGIPFWLPLVLVLSAIMQKPSIKGRVAYHTGNRLKSIYRSVQAIVFLVGVVGIWLSFNKTFGVDVAVSFLVWCCVAKTWEIYQKRDAYVVLNLALFVLASALLIRQDLGVALLGLISLMMILLGFVALSDEHGDGAGRLRALSMLTLPAIPLLVVLFLFFPRLPPLWALPLAGKSSTTGVSDTMSPGDFSNLSQSTELAFRVEFDATPPPRHEMYWRGLVFTDFDGKTWRQTGFAPRFWSSSEGERPPAWAVSAYQGQQQSYQVILEPTHQNWLFALDYPRLIPDKGIAMTSDFTLRSYFPINAQKRYRSSFYDDGKIDLTLSQSQKNINTNLPTHGNPQAREFARSLFEKSEQNPILYIHALQNFITDGGFRYTLSPPALQENRIDEFLFGTKAGFCEHYASSFAFLTRAVGIPTRVIGGYQGGELGRDGKSWEVRQMDAHAWTEVWLDGQGWVRIDPTSFVSPERIDDGMGAVTSAGGASMFGDGLIGQLVYRQFQFLQTLRRYSDQATYYWQRDVVGYDKDEQQKSLLKWFNISSFAEQFWALVGSVLVLALVFVLVNMYRYRRRYHALDLPLVRLQKRLVKIDPTLAKADSEPYLSWLDRVGESIGQKDDIVKLQAIYRKHRYGKTTQVDEKTATIELTVLVRQIAGK